MDFLRHRMYQQQPMSAFIYRSYIWRNLGHIKRGGVILYGNLHLCIIGCDAEVKIGVRARHHGKAVAQDIFVKPRQLQSGYQFFS